MARSEVSVLEPGPRRSRRRLRMAVAAMTTKAEIAAGLEAWAVLIRNSRQSTRYMERADAARRGQEAPARKVPPGLGGPRPAAG